MSNPMRHSTHAGCRTPGAWKSRLNHRIQGLESLRTGAGLLPVCTPGTVSNEGSGL